MDEAWRFRASCLGLNPAMFFPPAHRGKFRSMRPQAAAAKRVCAQCPVQAECLEAGVDAPGIWGGLEEIERAPTWARGEARWTAEESALR